MCMQPEPKTPNNDKKTTILGLGGSGGKIVHRIAEHTDKYNLIYVDSDERSLLESTVKTVKNTDKGQTDYFSIIEEIKNTKKLIITTGLGGEFGTFTGYIVYRIAKAENIRDIELVLTLPAKFEGETRSNKAREALELLDSDKVKYKLIKLDEMIDKLNKKMSLKDFLEVADEVVSQKIMENISS